MRWLEIDQHWINLEKVQEIFFHPEIKQIRIVFNAKDISKITLTSEIKYK